MIQLGTLADLTQIKELTEACAVAMQEKGIFQWNEHYPSRQKLEKDIRFEELYILKQDNVVAGIIVLTPTMDDEYLPIKWYTPNKKNLYVHRVAVHPSAWGQGYGQKLMEFAENFARKEGYVSIRLDTFSQNKRNQRFYEARGYERLGNIYFPRQSEYPFYCYEKVLD